MIRFLKVLSTLAVVLLALTVVTPIASSGTASASNGGSSNQSITVYFFYGNGCPHCALVEPLIESLAAKYPQVVLKELEVWYNSANMALFQNFNAQYGITTPVVPEVFIGGQALIAEVAIESNLESIIQSLINVSNVVSPSGNSHAEPAVTSAPTNPLPSTNPTNDGIQVPQGAPEVPTVETPSSGTQNTTTTPNEIEPPVINASTNPASIVGIEPAFEAPTAIKATLPELNFTTADGAVFNSSQATIQWDYTSGQSNVAAVEVAIDNGTFSSIASDAKSYVASGLSDGQHALVLTTTDKNGSSSEHKLNFTVDLGSQSSSLLSSSLIIEFAAFILFVGVSLVFVHRMRRKT